MCKIVQVGGKVYLVTVQIDGASFDAHSDSNTFKGESGIIYLCRERTDNYKRKSDWGKGRNWIKRVVHTDVRH